jgi:hypothetical protein
MLFPDGLCNFPGVEVDVGLEPQGGRRPGLCRLQSYPRYERRGFPFQVRQFSGLHRNPPTLDFSLLLPDVMIIAGEVDVQLAQT